MHPLPAQIAAQVFPSLSALSPTQQRNDEQLCCLDRPTGSGGTSPADLTFIPRVGCISATHFMSLSIIGVEVSMSVSWPVYASVLTAGLLGSSGIAGAEELGPEQARAFVVGKLFAFTCFEGTTGMGRILSDGSVVGAIRIHGQGETRFAKLPAGTVRIDGQFLCAHLAGLPFKPCARVEKIDYRSFRSSLVGEFCLLRLLPAQSSQPSGR